MKNLGTPMSVASRAQSLGAPAAQPTALVNNDVAPSSHALSVPATTILRWHEISKAAIPKSIETFHLQS